MSLVICGVCRGVMQWWLLMGRMAKKARGEHTPKIYWSVGQNLVKFDGSHKLIFQMKNDEQ